MTARIGSLFAGYGGLDLAVESVLDAEPAWFVEFDDAPSRILAHHWPHVPNYGDVTAVDWTQVEPVDILTGGFPCQDVSAAGRRAGLADGTRSGLWSHMAEAINVLRPQYVIIENVRGLLSATAHRPMESEPDALGDRNSQPVLRALGAVLGDLADLGYDAQWVTVAAADVGACHRRERVFILATPANSSRDRFNGHPQLDSEPVPRVDSVAGGHDHRRADTPRDDQAVAAAARRAAAADPSGDGRDEGRPESAWLVGRPDAAIGGLPSGRGVDLLPTPTASERGDCAADHARKSPDLAAVTHYFPTPIARDHHGRSSPSREGTPGLVDAVVLLPTVGAADATGGGVDPAGRVAGGHHVQIIDAAVGMATGWGKYAGAVRRAEQAVGRAAPAPTEPNKNGNPRLNAAFAEWMQMLPAGWVTDPAMGLTRAQQLKAIGNGVCPPQAAHALRQLLQIARTQ